MPTTEQIIQINSVNNDISVDPDPTNNFYKSSNNTDSLSRR